MKLSIIVIATSLVVMACTERKDRTPVNMTISGMDVPADSLSAEPHLVTDPKGEVLLSWVEQGKDSSRFLFSRLNGDSWGQPQVIAKGSSWFINWADYPMIASDGGSNLVAHLLNKSGTSTYAYDVQVFLSSNDGSTWKSPFVLHDDGKQAEHGFVSLAPFKEGIFIAWLDGRNTAMEGMDNMKGMDHSGHHGAMSLRAVILGYDGTKTQEWELDNKTCDCCQTAAAITDKGPIVVYRDRSDEEIRDMSIVRLVNGSWTKPKPIHRDNWKIAGCPVNGPRLAVDRNRVAVAWFSAATEPAHVNVAFSTDSGETFGDAIIMDDGKAIGRVDIEWIDEERAIVCWMEGALIKAAVVYADGGKDSAITIAESSEARSSGFPQMTRSGNRLVLAWTDDKIKRIKAATISLN